MEPANLLLIMADQHNRNTLGCYGHPAAKTPNLDHLAKRGATFTRAYTTSPICVPARASFATGRYVHEIGCWDNAFPYRGAPQGWAHRLRALGHRVESIGKLHFSKDGDDHGFGRSIHPLYVVDGVGDVLGCVRDDPPVRSKRDEVKDAGPGSSAYLEYDVKIAGAAVDWILERGKSPDPKPWVCFLSFVGPHPPYIAPPEEFAKYTPDQVPLPVQWSRDTWPDHPAVERIRRIFGFDEPFDEADLRKLAVAYLGACSHLDTLIGRVLWALGAAGLEESTRVVYLSDHGEHLGARGVFGKYTLYEESAAIPLIVAGPGVPAGVCVATPVSLVDLYPTALDAVGAPQAEDEGLPGTSLFDIAAAPDRNRAVLCEYHAVGSAGASFMVADRRFKYIHHVGGPAQLFDLENDPHETIDLCSPAHRTDETTSIAASYERRLRRIIFPHSPEEIDRRAKSDQAAKIAAFGGVDAVKRRGTFGNSPVPGESAKFESKADTLG